MRDEPAPQPRWASRRVMILVILMGIALRFAFVDRPLDNRLNSPWREADYGSIARSFDREGLNPLYPKVDWRGDTPGYVEMELPVLPFLGGALYRVFGEHAQILRILSALLESASLVLLALLASRLLPPVGAVFAVAAYAFNQTLIELGSSMQPEPVMLCACLGAVVLLERWLQGGRVGYLYAACAATAAGLLGKATAAYLGLVIAWAVLSRLGWRALKDPRVYLAAAIALVPPIAWYGWAHHFFTDYGVSIGMSNESHLLGVDMLWPPAFLAGILKLETTKVFTPLGWILALAGVMWWRRPTLAVVWYGAVALYYLGTARTSADGWAYYYHSAGVAPAALLMGAGVAALYHGELGLPLTLARARQVAGGLAAAVLLLLLGLGARSIHQQRERWTSDLGALYTCSVELARAVPPDGLIVVQGGEMRDEYGKPVAYNRPMAFAWMDRRGFNYGLEETSVATLEALARRGGRYWMVLREDLSDPRLAGAQERFTRIATCEAGYDLFDLRGAPVRIESALTVVTPAPPGHAADEGEAADGVTPQELIR